MAIIKKFRIKSFKNINSIIKFENVSIAYGNRTVLDNINFWSGLSSSKLTKNEIVLLLETFSIQKYQNTKTMYLSSGEIKKLELLRLILEQKKLWILDEPYNHLDDLSIEILNQTFIDHVNKDGIILFTSHLNPIIDNLEVVDL